MWNLLAAGAVSAACIFSIFAKKEKGLPRFEDALAKYHLVLLAAVLLAGIFVRFYKLAEIPAINVDEAGAAYDAWCLRNYGTDRWLTSYPVYLNNFGSGQSAMLAYLVSLSYRLFGGYSLFAVRAVTATAGCLGILNAYWLLRLAYGKNCGLFAALLYAVCPIFIATSRMGLDCYLMLTFFGFSVVCVAKAASSGKTAWYLLSGFALGLTLYTYILSWVAVPLFLAACLFLLLFFRKAGFKKLLALCLPLLLLALPLVAQLLVNLRLIPSFRIGILSFRKIFDDRSGDIGLSYIKTNLRYLGALLFSSESSYGSVAGYYTMYLFSVPLLVLGLFESCRRIVRGFKARILTADAILLAAFLSIFCVMLCVVRPAPYKMNFMFFCFVFYAAVGARRLWQSRRIFIPVLACFYIAGFACYSSLLFGGSFMDYCRTSTFQPYSMDAYDYTSKKFPDRTIYMYGSDMGSDGYLCGHVLALLNDLESPYYFNETLAYGHDSYSYGRLRFYRPVYSEGSTVYEEIYDDCVYLLYDYAPGASENLDYTYSRLTELGFRRERYLGYSIFYK